jgi:hypothetical protein
MDKISTSTTTYSQYENIDDTGSSSVLKTSKTPATKLSKYCLALLVVILSSNSNITNVKLLNKYNFSSVFRNEKAVIDFEKKGYDEHIFIPDENFSLDDMILDDFDYDINDIL